MKENIYYIRYIILRWEYEWKEASGEGYYFANNEDEAIAKCVIPLIKKNYAVDIREIKKIKIQ